MSTLQNKQIVLGVTGGIAAYKAAELVRRLQDAGAIVQVVMTPAGEKFVTPLTFQALSGRPVRTSLLDPEAEAGMGHIELARWADLILVAPATADIIARMAHGLANDLLTTLILATNAPVAVAPAMNQAMWKHSATQNNIKLLCERNVKVFGPDEGDQACGDVGPGRMLDANILVGACEAVFSNGKLAGKQVLITAGPTRESIDPVRYISNHSSGKMGFALAQAALEAGATVKLIAGPVALPTPSGIERIDVVSAQQMLQACQSHAHETDLFIATAAVADYRTKQVATNKIKKKEGMGMVLELEENPDILASIAREYDIPVVIGFAAETHNMLDYARQKLTKKNLQAIIANDVSSPDIGFNSDYNAVTLVTESGTTNLPSLPKLKLAREIVSWVTQQFFK